MKTDTTQIRQGLIDQLCTLHDGVTAAIMDDMIAAIIRFEKRITILNAHK